MGLPSSLALPGAAGSRRQGRFSCSESGIAKQVSNVGTFPNPRDRAEPQLHRGRAASPSRDTTGTAEPPRPL